MSVILAFLFGCVAGSLVTQYWPWVRGALGAARDRVFGARPARADNSSENRISDELRDSKTQRAPINWTRALSNIFAFFAGLFGWIARNPIAAAGIAILILWLVVGASCSAPFGKSKDALRLEREIEAANTRVAQLETAMAELSRELAVNTERDRSRRATVIAQAEQELNNAALNVDPNALYDAYVGGYLCLLDPAACSGGADSSPRRTPSVRGAEPDAGRGLAASL